MDLKTDPSKLPFKEQWANAILAIDEYNRTGKISTTVVQALMSVSNIKESSAITQVSPWRSQSTVGIDGTDGPQRVAAIASLLAKQKPRQVSYLISAFASFFLEEEALSQELNEAERHLIERQVENRCNSALSKLSGILALHAPNWYTRKKSKSEWIMFSLVLQLYNHCGKAGTAFRIGTKTWTCADEGLQVPKAAFASVRKALFNAKVTLNLNMKERLDEQLRQFQSTIPMLIEAPDFERFEKVPSDKRVCEPLSREFEDLGADYHGEKVLYRSRAVDEKLRAPVADKVAMPIVKPRTLDNKTIETYQIPDGCQLYAWLALREAFRNNEADLFNGIKVRPMTPLCAEIFESNILPMQRTTYFASQMTNWSTSLAFKDKATGEILTLRGDDGSPLSPLEMSNHYGVMTVVITSDSYLVIMYQDKMNLTAGGSLVPLGGSTEFHDLENYSDHKVNSESTTVSLGSYLRMSMRRELMEEADLGPESILKILLLGHTHDPTKGLKPDFFGVAFIKERWSEIQHNREEVFGGPLVARKIDISSKATFHRSVAEADAFWSKQKTDSFLNANLFYLRECSGQIVDEFFAVQAG